MWISPALPLVAPERTSTPVFSKNGPINRFSTDYTGFLDHPCILWLDQTWMI